MYLYPLPMKNKLTSTTKQYFKEIDQSGCNTNPENYKPFFTKINVRTLPHSTPYDTNQLVKNTFN